MANSKELLFRLAVLIAIALTAVAGPFNFSSGNTNTGFVMGSGVDYKIAPQFSFKLEGVRPTSARRRAERGTDSDAGISLTGLEEEGLELE